MMRTISVLLLQVLRSTMVVLYLIPMNINDEEDKCPSVPGLARYQGCPIPDTDGDGVNDEEDKCPTIMSTRENNGCPELKATYNFDNKKHNSFLDLRY